jgi:DNA-binding GntR family transcriptional regulator
MVMGEHLETIPQVTREVEVLNRLRNAILDGRFPPGSPLNQVQIAAQFGTSRGPVRVALNNLEKEGLVRNLPYRGTFVTPLEKKTVNEVYGVRAKLEAYGVQLAVEHCQPKDIEQIRLVIDEMRSKALAGDTDEVIRLDLQVHEFFIELSGNHVLMQTWATLKIQVQWILTFRHRSYPDLVEIADSHLPLLEAMESRDGHKAALIMEDHILDAGRDLIERWVGPDQSPE